ncbi:hypothetical protein EV07_1408 [Prochlorococcus sp. MIT 0603]|nr:hypothetical protein EV07_1408 [Prochlorococcus sp. MIT 0603]
MGFYKIAYFLDSFSPYFYENNLIFHIPLKELFIVYGPQYLENY